MTIPSVQITPEGYRAPTREEVTAGLWRMMSDAFGNDINQDARTPQGQLVTSLTAACMDKDAQFIELANNFDPRFATGKFQEALGAIYFLTRATATHSVVRIEFTGLAGTVVPVGQQVQDENGNIWETTESGEVAVSTGTIELWARAMEPGPIMAMIGSINELLDAPEDIDRAENLTPAIPGINEESRVDFELRRAESVSANSRLTNQAVRGAVFDLDGVIDVRVVDNPSDDAITVGATDYPMIRNSLLVSVVGGDDYEIAGRIMAKGGTGCAFVGNTEVLWRDTDSYDDGFPPEYTVRFLRPDVIPLYFDVKVADYNSLTFPQLQELRRSILRQLESGRNRARIGGRVVPTAFNCGIDSALNVVQIQVSTDNATWKNLIEFGIDEFPAIAENMITVAQYVPAD